MITNERQYRITKAELGRFEHARTQGDEHEAHLHPRLQQAMRESLESQIVELREELAEYEALRNGHVTVLELDSLAAIPDALIRARGRGTHPEGTRRAPGNEGTASPAI